VLADGCTDGTREAVTELGDPGVRVVEFQKGPGVGYGNRNEALRRTRGFVSWLGDDDLYLPDHVEAVGALFDTGEPDLVQAMSCIVREDSSLDPLGMTGGFRTPAASS
jgi:Glycosyl transferase family 2